ncbi:MAG: glycosyltransferase [Sphingomonadaceae bacterium]|nr:glycosyltransferase [Sphingomonadaceae bacterium]
MNILFIHQNMPGQFKHFAPLLARDQANKVVFLTKRPDIQLPGVVKATYKPPRDASPETHQYLRRLENAVRYGQQTARAMIELKKKGLAPDLIIAHPGWGESLFCKDIFPETPIISFCEFYYRGRGLDVDFDPEDPADLDAVCRSRIRACHLLSSVEACDAGVAPTEWQKSTHPAVFHDKIEVIFDGIDTDTVRPDPAASFTLPDGRTLTRDDTVITYVARNLEPYRGYRSFVRALPEMLRLQPKAEIIVVGGDEEVSYGSQPKDEEHKTWRAKMDAEVEYDHARVHFVGKLPYSDYLSVLRISAAHIYLTYPFVLSWSCLETMACEGLLVASATPPVQEVIQHGRNGLLVDFFDPKAIARQVDEAIRYPIRFEGLRQAARKTVLDGYTIKDCLPKWLGLIEKVTGRPALPGG